MSPVVLLQIPEQAAKKVPTAAPALPAKLSEQRPRPTSSRRFAGCMSFAVKAFDAYDSSKCQIAVTRHSFTDGEATVFFMDPKQFKSWINSYRKDGRPVQKPVQFYKELLCERAHAREIDRSSVLRHFGPGRRHAMQG